MIIKTIFIVFSSTILMKRSLSMLATHVKCRSKVYPRSNVERFPVPDDKVSWTSEFEGYDPPMYTSPAIHGKPWADPEIDYPSFKPKWNSIDGNVNRESYMGMYQVINGYPLNPIGRTGIRGRGVLGKWGPNHAADPVVTRWKRLGSGEVEVDKANKAILQFVAIKRHDTGEWALPGGMVDPGEKVTNTAVREFQEEAINSLQMTQDELDQWKGRFQSFFNSGREIYKGYVDDPRNTDNAWMETIAYNFHDDDGSVVGSLNLHAGDDAADVRWVDITTDIRLYASHKDIILRVLDILCT